MKLEVGKYYKSRDGFQFKCVHELNSEDDYRFLTVIDSGLFHQLNNIEGFSLNAPHHDLISEWVEPIEHEVDVYFWVNDEGDICCGDEPYGKLIAKVKVNFKEGEGL
jgi:hypothetical protein